MSERHRLRYSRIGWNTVYTCDMSNAKYVSIIKVTSVPIVKVANDFKSMYIGQQPLMC